MKKIFKLLALPLLFSSAFSLSSCAKESNITKVGTIKTVDGMNLYLTALAKGNVSSTYVYLGDADKDPINTNTNLYKYSDEIYEKANKPRSNIDIAYFPIKTEKETEVLKDFFANKDSKISNATNKFKLVYVDSYANENDLTPAGVWIGRVGWLNNSGNSKKFIAGLAKTANYRRSEMIKYKENGDEICKTTNDAYEMAYRDFANEKFTSFEKMYTFIETKNNEKKLPDFMFNDKNDKIVNYKSIYEYTALFAIQNKSHFGGDNLEIFKNSSSKDKAQPFINNDKAKELYGETKDFVKDGDAKISDMPTEGQNIYNTLMSKLGITEDKVNVGHMRYGIYQTAHPTSSSGDMKKVIILSSVGGAIVVIVVGLLIYRRIKTGRKLFDVRKALDVDIALDDPRVIRRKDVAEDLKAIRIGLKLSIEDAAYLMHMPAKYLEQYIETGEIMVPKRLRARFISCYHLPHDYFDKAYNADDVL